MKLILRRDNIFYFSYYSHFKNKFAFGPDAFWQLQDLERFTIHEVNSQDTGLENEQTFEYAHDLKTALKMGGYNAVGEHITLVDYDECIFWSNALGSGNDAMWMCAWLEVFWYGWRIFLPQHESPTDLLKFLAHDAPFFCPPLKANFDAFETQEIFPQDQDFLDDKPSKLLCVLDENGPRFTRLSKLGLEAILANGPNAVANINLQEMTGDALLNHNVLGVLDREQHIFWVKELGYSKHFNISPDTSLWPGWTIVPSMAVLASGAGTHLDLAPTPAALKKYSLTKISQLISTFEFTSYDDEGDFERLISASKAVEINEPNLLNDDVPEQFIMKDENETFEGPRIIYEYKGQEVAIIPNDPSVRDWDTVRAQNADLKKKACIAALEDMIAIFCDKFTPELWLQDRRPPRASFKSLCQYSDGYDKVAYDFVYKPAPLISK